MGFKEQLKQLSVKIKDYVDNHSGGGGGGGIVLVDELPDGAGDPTVLYKLPNGALYNYIGKREFVTNIAMPNVEYMLKLPDLDDLEEFSSYIFNHDHDGSGFCASTNENDYYSMDISYDDNYMFIDGDSWDTPISISRILYEDDEIYISECWCLITKLDRTTSYPYKYYIKPRWYYEKTQYDYETGESTVLDSKYDEPFKYMFTESVQAMYTVDSDFLNNVAYRFDTRHVELKDAYLEAGKTLYTHHLFSLSEIDTNFNLDYYNPHFNFGVEFNSNYNFMKNNMIYDLVYNPSIPRSYDTYDAYLNIENLNNSNKFYFNKNLFYSANSDGKLELTLNSQSRVKNNSYRQTHIDSNIFEIILNDFGLNSVDEPMRFVIKYGENYSEDFSLKNEPVDLSGKMEYCENLYYMVTPNYITKKNKVNEPRLLPAGTVIDIDLNKWVTNCDEKLTSIFKESIHEFFESTIADLPISYGYQNKWNASTFILPLMITDVEDTTLGINLSRTFKLFGNTILDNSVNEGSITLGEIFNMFNNHIQYTLTKDTMYYGAGFLISDSCYQSYNNNSEQVQASPSLFTSIFVLNAFTKVGNIIFDDFLTITLPNE